MDSIEVLSEGTADHAGLYHQVLEYSQRPDGSLKPAELGRHHECNLGRWLSAAGARYDALPEHATLRDAHEGFHRTSARTVEHADAGTLPEGWLGEKGQLKSSLARLCVATARMTFKIA